MKWVPLPQLSHRELAVKIIRTSGIDLVHWHNALAEMMERELNETNHGRG